MVSVHAWHQGACGGQMCGMQVVVVTVVEPQVEVEVEVVVAAEVIVL